MEQGLIWFQFPGLEYIHCVFQGREQNWGEDPLAGNISFLQARDRAQADNARQSLRTKLSEYGMREWRECHQVHGDKVLIEPSEDNVFAAPEADGMMSAKTGCGLLIKTADCQPLLFASRSGKQIMAIHAGWRGNRINFPGKAVRAFCQQYRLSPRDVFVVRGPSLGPARAEFVNFDREWGPEFEKYFDRRTNCMNLWKLSRAQLVKAGVPQEQIYGIDICTASNDWLFFSYRKDKKCGRQASVIWMEK